MIIQTRIKADLYSIENIDQLCLSSSKERTQQVCRQTIFLIACVDRCRSIHPKVFSHFTIYSFVVMTKLCNVCLCNSYNYFVAFICFFSTRRYYSSGKMTDTYILRLKLMSYAQCRIKYHLYRSRFKVITSSVIVVAEKCKDKAEKLRNYVY